MWMISLSGVNVPYAAIIALMVMILLFLFKKITSRGIVSRMVDNCPGESKERYTPQKTTGCSYPMQDTNKHVSLRDLDVTSNEEKEKI
eukprot:CAMPEP_0178925546 /NCGR_PEP_ID=MMETSP0786-20121207/17977_1 /TAXON_ID=186022 /ORGANISM="Thalassionema frauenfeldii, Strain CCMP 1798" /LENGTH=87 /DNA_ID=CAMNT_0020600449 /DNA_START=28 /DNA_END=288 /DNA_ORIENTATION=-